MSPRPDTTPKAKWCGRFQVNYSLITPAKDESLGKTQACEVTFIHYAHFLDWAHAMTAAGNVIVICDILKVATAPVGDS